MSLNLNKTVFAGYIGQIQTAATGSGTQVTNLRIASTKRYTNKQSGQKQEKTTWMTAVAFGKTAEIIAQYFQEGDPIYVEGELQLNEWQDKHNQKRSDVQIHILEFQFVASKSDSGQSQQNNVFAQQQGGGNQYQNQGGAMNQQPQYQNPAQANMPNNAPMDFDDDDVHFG